MGMAFVRQVGLLQWIWRTAQRQFAKRILRSGVRLRLPTGLVMTIPRESRSGSEVFVTRSNIDWGSEAIFASFARGDFIDAGANIGYYSLYLSPRVRRVFAFEPDPRCFAALSANAAAGGNIVHIPKALSSRSGSARLDVSADAAVSALSDDGGMAVETITVDDFVASLSSPDIGAIKIDVEGHDLEVLQGARQTLTQYQPLVLAEITPEAVRPFADEIGYDVRAVRRSGQTKMTFLVPPRLLRDFPTL